MNTYTYKWILYLISVTIVLTIVVQGYWNYKNYKQNKQHFINDVQISLDNALENYYANLVQSKKDFGFVENVSTNNITLKQRKNADSLFKVI